jgi:putative acetyltransferase
MFGCKQAAFPQQYLMSKNKMIRKFKQSDIDQIIKIWLEASIKAHDFIESKFWESKVNDMKEIYLPSSETYVFEAENEIKGFISLLSDTLAALFVSPNCQGEGIGKQLILKSKAIRKKLILTVYKENSRSIEFYRKNGFRIIKEQIDNNTGHSELLMEFSS